MKLIFDWPVGLENERAQWSKLPGAWNAATLYGQHYDATGKWAYHTGLDLNLNTPFFDADAHSPVYAAADGEVTFCGKLPVWGMVIVVSHVVEFEQLWTRYAHGEALQVARNDHVVRGQMLARVGNADGRYPYHLHYDIARCDLTARPGDWPGNDLTRVLTNYIDPQRFMAEQLMEGEGAQPARVKVVATLGLRVHAAPSTAADKVGVLPDGTIVTLVDRRDLWGRIEQPIAGWISLVYTEPVTS